ncbi:hypothetical protein HK100_005220, partial [Physocladia obscura]
MSNSTLIDLISGPASVFIDGICFDMCFSALSTEIPNFYHRSKSQNGRKKYGTASIFFLMFNSSALISLLLTLVSQFSIIFSNRSACVGVNWFSNFIWHCYFVTFNAFILYKSAIVVEFNRVYVAVAVLGFLYRIAWTVVDLVLTQGVWDPVEGTCTYESSAISGYNYTLADILCDVVATVAAVFMFFKPENRNLKFSLWYHLAKEN